ncbi:hypothetical protein EG244_16095 [Falsigemmobacter faecalis]|uniref:Uncharacterized protein n=1 Tax=Falsigemmobacter faecalis TaxID=2488730 RepID=A0A3P3DG06_9RHOB|nr:hypothetical protein EG244_16095 [Falsigemmobacter faecalis]
MSGGLGGNLRCLIPRFDGEIFSREWKDVLWDKFVMEAPRSSHGMPLIRVTMARARRQSSNTEGLPAIGSTAGLSARGVEPGARNKLQDSRQMA